MTVRPIVYIATLTLVAPFAHAAEVAEVPSEVIKSHGLDYLTHRTLLSNLKGILDAGGLVTGEHNEPAMCQELPQRPREGRIWFNLARQTTVDGNVQYQQHIVGDKAVVLVFDSEALDDKPFGVSSTRLVEEGWGIDKCDATWFLTEGVSVDDEPMSPHYRSQRRGTLSDVLAHCPTQTCVMGEPSLVGCIGTVSVVGDLSLGEVIVYDNVDLAHLKHIIVWHEDAGAVRELLGDDAYADWEPKIVWGSAAATGLPEADD